jgi:hypothetical protein
MRHDDERRRGFDDRGLPLKLWMEEARHVVCPGCGFADGRHLASCVFAVPARGAPATAGVSRRRRVRRTTE